MKIPLKKIICERERFILVDIRRLHWIGTTSLNYHGAASAPFSRLSKAPFSFSSHPILPITTHFTVAASPHFNVPQLPRLTDLPLHTNRPLSLTFAYMSSPQPCRPPAHQYIPIIPFTPKNLQPTSPSQARLRSHSSNFGIPLDERHHKSYPKTRRRRKQLVPPHRLNSPVPANGRKRPSMARNTQLIDFTCTSDHQRR